MNELLEDFVAIAVSVPSRGLGSFLHEAACVLDKLIVFPSPLEVWVGSYTSSKIWMSFLIIVSGPSRGLGSFLLIPP